MSQKKKLSSYSILAIIILALVALSWIVALVSPDSGVVGATLGDFTMSIFNGFQDAMDVCVFVFVLGGFLAIVAKTGALDTGIAALVKKLNGKEEILIAVLMFVFSIGGTTYGMWEETVPFYLLLATTMYIAGFDTVVGAATVCLGAGVGVLGSTINPFATGIAMSTAVDSGVTINSGLVMVLGAIIWLTSYAIALFFVLKYAKKVKADKGSTILSLQEQENMKELGKNISTEKVELTGKQKGVLIAFALTFIIMICGFIPWVDLGIIDADIADAGTHWSAFLTGSCFGYWWFGEASTWFLIMSIVVAFIGGLSESDYVDNFVKGAGDMMGVVLVVAVARGASVIMGTTGLTDWILAACASILQGVSELLFAPLAYILYLPLSFFIPSSSGLATVSMPIMAPLTETLGFAPEVMILIFSAANGLVNLIAPTAGALMGGLSISKVDWTTWVKFVGKVLLVIALANIVILTAAMFIL